MSGQIALGDNGWKRRKNKGFRKPKNKQWAKFGFTSAESDSTDDSCSGATGGNFLAKDNKKKKGRQDGTEGVANTTEHRKEVEMPQTRLWNKRNPTPPVWN